MKKLTPCLLLFLFVTISCEEQIKNYTPEIEDQTFHIDENAPEGMRVGWVDASDANRHDYLDYSIVGGNKDEAFQISHYGVISINNEDAIDYESNPSFTLLVQVVDEKQNSAEANITIKLHDLEISTEGLLLYMPFDGNLRDFSRNKKKSNNYTSSNYVPGIKGQALDFNGTTDYVQLNKSINAKNGLSFVFWINSRGAQPNQNNGVIIGKYNMSGHHRSFLVSSFGVKNDNKVNKLSTAFYKYGYTSSTKDHLKSTMDTMELSSYSDPTLWTFPNPRQLSLNKWIHCIVNVTDTTMGLWMNGKLCAQKQREYQTYYDFDNEPVFIGNIPYLGEGTNNHFNGMLDELRIYNRGLTPKEITTLYKE